MNYSIENLEVYRKAVSLASTLSLELDPVTDAEKLMSTLALDMVQHVAVGLGFWEADVKAEEFMQAKNCLLRLLSLLDVQASTTGSVRLKKQIAEQQTAVRELCKMVSGLLRGVLRREE